MAMEVCVAEGTHSFWGGFGGNGGKPFLFAGGRGADPILTKADTKRERERERQTHKHIHTHTHAGFDSL